MSVILPELIYELLSFSLDLFELFLLVFNLSVVFAIVFVERRKPTAALAWVGVLMLIPYLGFVLYLLFGRHLYKERIFRLKRLDDDRLRHQVDQQVLDLKGDRIGFNDPSVGRFMGLIRLLLAGDRAVISTENEVEVHTEGEPHFEAMLEAIASAEHHIHLEYYIIRNDALGRRFVEALTTQAQAGVEVRVIYDAVGCLRLPRGFFAPIRRAGGRVVPFFPGLFGVINFRINYRNHRKILVVDGRTGFVGGHNIGVEYLGQGPLGYWRDAHIRLRGPAVASLQTRFIQDWNYAAKDDLSLTGLFFPEPDRAGTVACQIASSGPDRPRATIKQGFLRLISTAERTLYIQTPYFVPDDSILDALRIAAVSGVDVRIMIPAKPDHLFVYWTTLSYLGDLLSAGVRAYTYDRGFIHAKTCVVDGTACTVGTANWDVRSFDLNFETNAFIYDRATGTRLLEAFEADLAHCTELTPERYAKRPRYVRYKESISRLLTPLL